jgi:hypothetical protein
MHELVDITHTHGKTTINKKVRLTYSINASSANGLVGFCINAIRLLKLSTSVGFGGFHFKETRSAAGLSNIAEC